MSRRGIATQLKTQLVRNGRGYRAGNDNMLHYLSAILDNGPQVDALREFLDAPPRWLSVKREGSRIIELDLQSRAIGASHETVDLEEVPTDLDELIKKLLGVVWGENARLRAEMTTLRGDYEAAERLLDEHAQTETRMTSPVTTAQVSCGACETRDQELVMARTELAALRSVIKSNKGAITEAVTERKKAERALKQAERQRTAAERCHDETHQQHLDLLQAVLREGSAAARALAAVQVVELRDKTA